MGENTVLDLKDTGFEAVDWIRQAQDRIQCRALENTVLNLPVPYNSGMF
jgi:hypothetical protein